MTWFKYISSHVNAKQILLLKTLCQVPGHCVSKTTVGQSDDREANSNMGHLLINLASRTVILLP